MMRSLAVTLLLVLMPTACSTVPTADASPAVPQQGASCPAEFDGALTRLADRTLLACHGGKWAVDTEVYPSSERWVSYGPALTVYGQGRRNPEVLAGSWVGTPQGEDARCSAEQAVVASAGVIGPPSTVTAEPNSPLKLTLPTPLFTVGLSGFCLWERDA